MATGSDIPLGWIEPHAHLLRQPPHEQRLYKIVRIHYLLDMLKNNYLHFRRVDTYDDIVDGEQLPLDRNQNKEAAFQNDPNYTMARYYDGSRARTYACCFSLENSSHIWREYGKEDDAVCLVFEFGKLRRALNDTMQSSIENELLLSGDYRCKQIFSINYGIVEYIERGTQNLNTEQFPNPIKYTFTKEKQKYADERELRVSLSALGIGTFVLADRSQIPFPPALQFFFNFREAFVAGTIEQLLYAPSGDLGKVEHLNQEMEKLGFQVRQSKS
jgi:DUF2971 family protein